MISRALILKDKEVLMEQYVQRGAIVWTFPGGGIEKGETPEQACIREVSEETGFDIHVKDLLLQKGDKYSYTAEIVGGRLHLNKELEDNQDILEVAWVSIHDTEKFDHITQPILNLLLKKEGLRV